MACDIISPLGIEPTKSHEIPWSMHTEQGIKVGQVVGLFLHPNTQHFFSFQSTSKQHDFGIQMQGTITGRVQIMISMETGRTGSLTVTCGENICEENGQFRVEGGG